MLVEDFDGPARRAITEAKQRSQRSAIGWVTKIYYLELLRASEDTLSRWSRLHLQSLAAAPVSLRVEVLGFQWYPRQNKRRFKDEHFHLRWTAIRRRWAYHLSYLQYFS
jgi:hypothetical protein